LKDRFAASFVHRLMKQSPGAQFYFGYLQL
jgi:hypothetical protein